MKIAVLVKQVPRVEDMALDEGGRLRRDGVALEMNAYCRRAVSKGVDLARQGGHCIVYTLGPSSAEDTLREAIAWGADEGVLITDPVFAGSDTLATARTLAAALEAGGPFDLVLAGRNSIDADTGQVAPEVAELLDLPFVSAVKDLEIEEDLVRARCELDDGFKTVELRLPAVLSVAERLTEPCKVPPEEREMVDPARIKTLTAADLGPGPWGSAGSPTVVGEIRTIEISRHRQVLSGPVAEQVKEAVALLASWGSIELSPRVGESRAAPETGGGTGLASGPGLDDVGPSVSSSSTDPLFAVVVEPGRPRVSRELLGEAVHLATRIGARVVAIGPSLFDPWILSGWGADAGVELAGAEVEEDVAEGLSRWCEEVKPWAVLAPGTLWGREVASRTAARLRAGLTGDAVGFGVDNGRLVSWKPAFGGRLVAAITATSDIQLATVRPGVLELRVPRQVEQPFEMNRIEVAARNRVKTTGTERDDDVEALLSARAVVAVGTGVAPDEYPVLEPLLKALGAELGASRKVTDMGWLPRARQIGITGHCVDPALYVAIGISGKFNHMVGSRSAGTILAINHDPAAPVFEWADVGITADWHEVVPNLVKSLE